MISRRTKEYCCEDISLIENYELAITDTSQIWECHHKAEILPCGVYSIADLEKFGLYWHRPASELILLTSIEHHRLHNANLSQNTIDKKRGAMLGKISGMKGKHHSEETKIKLSEKMHGKFKGRKLSDETKNKISESTKRVMNTPEMKNKLSKIRTGKKQSPETIEKRMSKIRGVHRSAQWKKAISNKEQILNLFNSGLCYFKIEKILKIDHKIIKEIIMTYGKVQDVV